jgi:CelD/BcsL family acetyltransferase involved in cellulose biosynthesis
MSNLAQMLASALFILRSADPRRLEARLGDRTAISTHIPEPAAEAPAPRPFSDEALLLTDAPVPGLPAGAATRPRPHGDELWTETVTDWTRLAALQSEWQELSESAAEPNPFYEPWMLLPALRSFAGRGEVEVVLVVGAHPSRAKGRTRLVGLFPLLRKRGRIELWRHPYCYLTAPLLRRGSERAALSCWLDHVATLSGVVRLEDTPGDGPLRAHLVDELYARGWPSLVSHSYTRAVLRRAPTAEEFLTRALAGKRRKELRRQRARLAEQGELSLEELPPGQDPRSWVEEFLELEAAGWKGREGVAAAHAQADRDFMAEMAVRAASEGRLQMLALRLNRKPVALKLNLISGEGAFAFKITFDESFSRFSPGVLLELDNVEKAHQLPGLRWMDSCAAPNRFMINHLWPDRREMQTVFFSTGGHLGALAVALVPLLHFVRARLPRREAQCPSR